MWLTATLVYALFLTLVWKQSSFPRLVLTAKSFKMVLACKLSMAVRQWLTVDALLPSISAFTTHLALGVHDWWLQNTHLRCWFSPLLMCAGWHDTAQINRCSNATENPRNRYSCCITQSYISFDSYNRVTNMKYNCSWISHSDTSL